MLPSVHLENGLEGGGGGQPECPRPNIVPIWMKSTVYMPHGKDKKKVSFVSIMAKVIRFCPRY